MNSAGMRTLPSGSTQRTSASKPTTRALRKSTLGWKAARHVADGVIA